MCGDDNGQGMSTGSAAPTDPMAMPPAGAGDDSATPVVPPMPGAGTGASADDAPEAPAA